MTKGRIEAFSDGVLAIIITIMVLEMKVPHRGEFGSLLPVLPVMGGYALSFLMLGIYWNNHHHLFQAVRHVDGRVLWANLHLLFWLSLMPFFTAWMGETRFALAPVVLYGAILLLAGLSYFVLVRVLIASHADNAALGHAVGADLKGKLSLGIYALAIPLAIVHPAISCGLYLVVALVWLVPDRRIERSLRHRS